MKQKHWKVSVFDKTSEVIKNDTFYTTDTEAYLIFELIDEDFTPDSAIVTVYNIYGKATINASVEVVDGIVRYEMPEDAIGHPGGWRTQVIFTKDDEDYTTKIIEFDVGGHLLDNKKPAIVDIENWNSFIAHAGELIDDWEQLEEIRQANETSRQTNELVREEAENNRQSTFEENEQGRESAESVRVSNEEERELNEAERISKDSERDSKMEEVEGLQADLISGAVDSAAVQQHVEQRYGQLEEEYAPKLTEVAAQLAQRVGGLQPVPLRNVKVEDMGSDPAALDIFDGYVWGVSGSSIYRRALEKGSPWQLYTTKGISAFRLLPTDDGEVLLLNSGQGIFKSSNWAEPDNVTWTNKVEPYGVSNFLRWGFDGNGTKFIATTYSASDGFPDSRYVYISTDAGETWKIAYDSVEIHGQTLADQSHMHAVAYDHYADRFYVSEGHRTEIGGIYVSTDDGDTWRISEKMRQAPAPTTITVTPTGLVCGFDNSENGLYGVVRMDDPMDEELVQTWSWKTHRDSLIGFARRGYYEPESGLVYVAFKSDYADVKPVIAAGTPTSGGLVYEWDSGGQTNTGTIRNILLPNSEEVLAEAVEGSNTYKITGVASPPGVVPSMDSGNINGGKSSGASSIAVGIGSETSGIHSVAVGVNSKTIGAQNSTAVGDKSSSDTNAIALGTSATASALSVAVGVGAKSDGANSVSIGVNASTPGSNSVAIGRNSESMLEGLAVGSGAKNTGNNSTAVGMGAESGFRSVSVGHGAKAITNNSVALGYSIETTLNDQVNLGRKHVVIERFPSTNISGSLPENSGAFFVRLRNEKLELCFKFSDSSDVHILAVSE